MYKIIGGDGREYGPVSVEQLRQWIAEGRANAQTQILPEGATSWQPLGLLPEFATPPSINPPPLSSPPVAGATGAAVAPRHQLSTFSVALVVLLHFLTCGIFTFIWLNLMHGKLPRIRPDDPSAGKAIGFCFIPFFNLYWIFFTYRRLCLRVDEQRALYGLPPSNLRGMATTACIFQVIPYINLLIGATIMTPIFAGMMQSSVNELAQTSATTAPRGTLLTTQTPAPAMSAGVIVCICIIPFIAFIGLLAALAIPGFVKARKQAQGRRVLNDARQMDAAIDQWALEKGKRDGDPIITPEASVYLKGSWHDVDLLGNRYEFKVVGRNQVRISPVTKDAINGVGVDWGAY